MPAWLGENPVATIVILIILLAAVGSIVGNIIRKRKKGQSVGCGCGCSSCPMKDGCGSKEKE